MLTKARFFGTFFIGQLNCFALHSRSFFFFIFAPMRNVGANADSEFARRPFKRRCVRVFAAGFARKHAPASARKISAVAGIFSLRISDFFCARYSPRI